MYKCVHLSIAICWFTHSVPETAESAAGLSKELGTQSGVSIWVIETQWKRHLLTPGVYVSSKLESGTGVKPSDMGCRH